LWRIDLQPQFPDLAFEMIATEVQPEMLVRAQNACYPVKTIRFTPPHWQKQAFTFTKNSGFKAPSFKDGFIL